MLPTKKPSTLFSCNGKHFRHFLLVRKRVDCSKGPNSQAQAAVPFLCWCHILGGGAPTADVHCKLHLVTNRYAFPSKLVLVQKDLGQEDFLGLCRLDEAPALSAVQRHKGPTALQLSHLRSPSLSFAPSLAFVSLKAFTVPEKDPLPRVSSKASRQRG